MGGLTDCLRRRLVRAPELHADVGRRADDVQPDHRHRQLHRLDLGAAERKREYRANFEL